MKKSQVLRVIVRTRTNTFHGGAFVTLYAYSTKHDMTQLFVACL